MTQAVVATRNVVARSGFANPITLGLTATDEDAIAVYADDELLVRGTDYVIDDLDTVSVTIIGADDPDNYVGYENFALVFDPPLDQDSDLSGGGRIGGPYETALDKIMLKMQALADKVARAFRFPAVVDLDLDARSDLPPTAGISNLAWDADNQRFIWAETPEQAEQFADAAAASAADAAQAVTDAEAQVALAEAQVAAATDQVALAAAQVALAEAQVALAQAQAAAAESEADDAATSAAAAAASAASLTYASQAEAETGTATDRIMSPLRVSQRITAALLSAIVNTASLVADAVTNDKLANMGQGTIKLRAVSAGTGDPVDGTADQALAILASSSDFIWATKAIGEIVMLPTHLTGITEPPTSSSLYRYIKLTAGLTGGGQYNNGVLTGESTSGSAPLVLASATISLAGSPINGQTVRLLNTEERILRPSTSAGTLQNDQMQQITGDSGGYFWGSQAVGAPPSGAFSSPSTGTSDRGATGSNNTRTLAFDSANSPGARAGTETRMKNVGYTAYMRIK